MSRLLVAAAFAICFVTSCSGTRSASVVPYQSRDKQLSCREILLEMNEAEEYRKSAEKNKDVGMTSFLAPLGYAYTITSANKAIDSSNERIKYLQEVYNISGCTGGNFAVDPNTGLTPQQMQGHTFTSGYPTPSPQQMLTQPPPAPVPVSPQPQFQQPVPRGYSF